MSDTKHGPAGALVERAWIGGRGLGLSQPVAPRQVPLWEEIEAAADAHDARYAALVQAVEALVVALDGVKDFDDELEQLRTALKAVKDGDNE